MPTLESEDIQHVSLEWLSLKTMHDNLSAFFSITSRPKQYQHDIESITPAHKISRIMKKREPIVFFEKRITVPAGMVSTYQQYSKTLDEAVEIASTLHSGILTPFYRYCGELLDLSNDTKQRKPFSALTQLAPNNIDAVLEKMGACFDSTSYVTTVPFKKAFKQAIQVELDAVVFSNCVERYQRTDRSAIFKTLRNINDVLVELDQQLTDKTDTALFTDQEQQQFSQLCYTVGREVEFYGHLGYRLQQLSIAFNRCVEQL